MKLNKPLLRKMIKRIETMPETYDQSVFVRKVDDARNRPVPTCGTVACLAGEAIICNAPSVAKGIADLEQLEREGDPMLIAAKAMGIRNENIFHSTACCWPQPFKRQYFNAKSYRGQAGAAIRLLKAILRTNGKILEEQ